MTKAQGGLTTRRVSGGVLMLLGVALVGYGAHYLIRNGSCSSTGYTEYGPVPKCGGAEALYIMSVFFLGPALAVVGWLMSRTSGWLWPLTCVSLAAGLTTIKVDSAATSGAKSLGLFLGACFFALAVLSVAITVGKRARPQPAAALTTPGSAIVGSAVLDAVSGSSSGTSAGLASYQPFVADAAGPAGPPGEDPLDRIAKLAQLRASGALTDAEFEREKAKLLSQM